MYHFGSDIEKYSRTDLIAVFDECYAVYQPVWDTLQKKYFILKRYYVTMRLKQLPLLTRVRITTCGLSFSCLW